MTYELKNGEEVRDGKLYGWTGERCRHCSGTGEDSDNGLDENFISWRCNSCGGTGDEWGLMPVQPTDLLAQEHECPCGRGEKPCPGPDGRPLCADSRSLMHAL